MNIYLISQSVNHGWDTYDSAVVIAKDAQSASEVYPGESGWVDPTAWAPLPRDVTVELIGTTGATKPRIVCASFNAG